MVKAGDLGEIRLVQVEYPQDWLTGPTETTGNKQAEWRVDPARSGAGGALGDIGTHAYNLADFVGGIEVQRARRRSDLVRRRPQARRQRADAAALRQWRARRLWASQVAPGQRERPEAARLRDEGRAAWVQANPNEMFWSPLGQSMRIVTRGGPDSGEAAARVTRIPPGHPEGYLEGFANIYSEVALAIKAARTGRAVAGGRAFPHYRGWREGPRVHRGGGGVIEGEWELGEAVGGSHHQSRNISERRANVGFYRRPPTAATFLGAGDRRRRRFVLDSMKPNVEFLGGGVGRAENLVPPAAAIQLSRGPLTGERRVGVGATVFARS